MFKVLLLLAFIPTLLLASSELGDALSITDQGEVSSTQSEAQAQMKKAIIDVILNDRLTQSTSKTALLATLLANEEGAREYVSALNERLAMISGESWAEIPHNYQLSRMNTNYRLGQMRELMDTLLKALLLNEAQRPSQNTRAQLAQLCADKLSELTSKAKTERDSMNTALFVAVGELYELLAQTMLSSNWTQKSVAVKTEHGVREFSAVMDELRLEFTCALNADESGPLDLNFNQEAKRLAQKRVLDTSNTLDAIRSHSGRLVPDSLKKILGVRK